MSLDLMVQNLLDSRASIWNYIGSPARQYPRPHAIYLVYKRLWRCATRRHWPRYICGRHNNVPVPIYKWQHTLLSGAASNGRKCCCSVGWHLENQVWTIKVPGRHTRTCTKILCWRTLTPPHQAVLSLLPQTDSALPMEMCPCRPYL